MEVSVSSPLSKRDIVVDVHDILGKDVSRPLKSHPFKAFSRWRPNYHCIAPTGWMNDPCGPAYDQATQTYRLSFQWNPTGNTWGNISWGQATSHDLITWKVSKTPSIVPSESYDHCAVYTGCSYSGSIDGSSGGELTQFYTSVANLPIHHTLPYTYGCESLSVVSSNDHGISWRKSKKNPILDGPPIDVTVTGWRDPFVSSWPSMAKILGKKTEDVLFGIVCGGIRDVTPTVFLYEVDAKNLSSWTYICPLADLGINKYPSRWSGDFGVNWEVVNFVTLESDQLSNSQEFLIIGSDGAIPRSRPGTTCEDQHNSQSRRLNLQLWMAGELTTTQRHESRLPGLTYDFGGFLDHGCLYAANSFWDPTIQQQVVFGWVLEEDLSERRRTEQGWQGLISLPRVLSLQVIANVTKARRAMLAEITSIKCVDNDDGTSSVTTMGISPHPRLNGMRHNALRSSHRPIPLHTLQTMNDRVTLHVATAGWELSSKISLSETCTKAGFIISHASGRIQPSKTILYFDALEEAFLIERKSSSLADPEINSATEYAPHTLFTTLDREKKAPREEDLEIRAYWDMSVLEVFINERTVITTRIYTLDGRCEKIEFFAEGGDVSQDGLARNDSHVAWLKEAILWDGIGPRTV